MCHSTTNAMTPECVLAAVRALPPSQDLIGDGQDEDDRPASEQALRRALTRALADRPRNTPSMRKR